MSTGQGFEGYNMYAYCGNNPVNLCDCNGAMPRWLKRIPKARRIRILIKINKTISTYRMLNSIGFTNETYKSAEECNNVLNKYDIDTPEEKAHFFAQCAYESNYGLWLTELGDKTYFSNKDYGYKYRGAGYIQLTWDYNYRDFSIAMDDDEIYNQGADYVAKNYAWRAAGWFWSMNDINNRIENGISVMDVTEIVKGSSSTWEIRQNYYNNFLAYFNH